MAVDRTARSPDPYERAYRAYMGNWFERRIQRWLRHRPRVRTEVRVSILADRPIDRYELGRLIGSRFPAYSLTEPQHERHGA